MNGPTLLVLTSNDETVQQVIAALTFGLATFTAFKSNEQVERP